MTYINKQFTDVDGNVVAFETSAEQVMMADGQNLEEKLKNFKPGGGGGGGGEVDFNKPMPSVSIQPTWTFYNNKGASISASTISPVPNATNPVLEYGYKAKFSGTYKWNSGKGTKAPTAVTSDSTFKDLPADGAASKVYTSPLYAGGATILAKIYAPKTGLMVNGNDVIPAKGNDYAQASVSVGFRHRIYYGLTKATSVGEAQVKALSNRLASGRGGRVDNVKTTSDDNFVYAYPKSLGMLTSIEQDGKYAVLGAFVDPPASVKVTNASGLVIDYYVYVTKNKGAFPDNFLVFI